MANELKEITEIVKKCKILLLDIEGTTTSISFVKDKLFPYAEEKVKQFLESQWENEAVKEVVTELRKLALEDKEKSVDGVVAIPGEDASKEEQIEGLVNNVKWQMSADRKAGPLKQLQGLIWKQGYDSGDIKGHVYDDVSSALEQWQSVDGQKVYIYSSGSVQAQKLLFGQSQAGDLLKFIEGHFDTAVGAKQEAASYSAITEKIGCKPDEILFLTDIVKEAEAARKAGLHAALVSREGNAPLSEEATKAFAVLHSLGQLVSNKRKTEPQDELPAKIAKTEDESDAKTTSGEKSTEAKAEEKVTDTSDKMEGVEESVTSVTEEVKENNKETEKAMVAETCVKETAAANGQSDAPVADVEPVVTQEKTEKTEEKPAEKMETDSTENDEAVPIVEEKDEVVAKTTATVTKDDGPIAEETPPTVEIKDVTNDVASEVAGEALDVEPVIEEPPATEDMEVLQSVGEVLEKECDEILSKVQDVTNLDTIPVKPLLNTITEETMETENADTSDIVDRILDSELEMEMKQNENAKSVKEEEKKEPTEEKKAVAGEANNKEPEKILEGKTQEKPEETKSEVIDKETEEKTSESSKTETKEESKAEESKNDETKKETEASVEAAVEQKPAENSAESDTNVPIESKDSAAADEAKPETESTESQVNGKTNGESQPVSLNGDASKNEELSSRLSAENGKKEEVNGSNGASVDAEKKPEEKKVEPEIPDIKVKSVPTEEPHTEPIEQPTEA